MIGDRIRQARLAAGLTQDELVARLAEQGQRITKAGISKYELNKSMPKASFVLALARSLGVRSSYFLQEPTVSAEWLAFRKHARLPEKAQDQIRATALNIAEGQLWLRSTLYPRERLQLPTLPIRSLDEAEAAAEKLRARWGLGEAPIESVTQTTEDHGGVVIGWESNAGAFDGLAGWLNKEAPVIVTNTAVAPDRRRFTLAHELAHLLMGKRPASDEDEAERLAHRFAGAFLVPAAVARRELGERRRHLSLDELALLKLKYGMSLQAWVHRAHDLGIIDRALYDALYEEIKRRGWKEREEPECEAAEEPARLKQMTLRALSEGIITEERALQLCPGCIVPRPAVRPEGRRYTARELLKLPREERERILAAQAEEAAEEYRTNPELTEFEAFGDDNLFDEYPE